MTRLSRRFSRWAALGLVIVVAVAALATVGFVKSSSAHPAEDSHGLGTVTALPGYKVSIFAEGTTAYFGPDSIVNDGSHVYIDYQNKTAKDCTDAATTHSTVVEYTLNGKVVKTFDVPGHSDGMREDPSAHLLWVTSCEDGNPRLVTINPQSSAITPYTFPPALHGGGYDDLAFLGGKAFIAASNPNLDAAGVNVYPAVDSITLSNGKVVLTPVLMGNATATDVTTNSTVTLNEVDPDSLTRDTKGDLVLVNQGGSELVIISRPGTAQQSVSRLPVGTQLDDTVWPTAKEGSLFVTDGKANTTYTVRTTFTVGSIYTEAPSDSGVAGFLGTVDPTTGIVKPTVIGMNSPTGMIFVPNGGGETGGDN